MTFKLTDELIESIISAMDNQESVFVVDAAANQLVMADGNKYLPDDNNFYALPEWKSADGFEMREAFVNQLHSPLAHDELQNVLHSGRGVFKNFRSVLKSYPEIDKRWHFFKHRTMSARINDWYNSLREIWGLEKLDQLSESEQNLVHDDFSFKEYDPEHDKEMVLLNIPASAYDDENLPSEVPLEVIEAICKFWRNQFENDKANLKIGYVCYSLSDEFSGCITASSLLDNQENILTITSLFVPEQFRGLGIGTELLNLCITKLEKLGCKWVLLPNFIAPDLLQPLLIRTGFKKISSGYILQL
ncbi:MAG: GNAT family N-acetyltransferase [Treponema sp.]|nr:GNAT family N-acetyltransferase [Treponema sp.]